MRLSPASRTRAASIFLMSVDLSEEESMSVSGNHMASAMRNTLEACAEGMSATTMGSHAAAGTGPTIFMSGLSQ